MLPKPLKMVLLCQFILFFFLHKITKTIDLEDVVQLLDQKDQQIKFVS